jgi:hypothetical protein
MPPQTPYTADLAGREPIAALRETTSRIGAIAGAWSPDDFERAYAPGKWTARQLLIHLAQTELALGARARMALTTPNYSAQSFNQDVWIRWLATRFTTLLSSNQSRLAGRLRRRGSIRALPGARWVGWVGR